MGSLRAGMRLALANRALYALLLAGAFAAISSMMLRDALQTVTGPPEAVPVVMPPMPVPGMRSLTFGGHMDGFSAWSPDGKQIAFMRDGRIHVMNASGGGTRAVTRSEGGWDVSPAWRPDGRGIGFIRLWPDKSIAQIMTVAVVGGRETAVAEEKEPVGYLAWGIRSGSLYYTLPDRVVRLQGGKAEIIFRAPEDWDLTAGGIAIRPDEKEAIFGAAQRGAGGTSYDLYSIELERSGAAPQRLTRAGGIMPSYHPKASKIAYRNPRQRTGLYIMELPTHTITRVLSDSEKAMFFHPAFSPDGRSLAVSGLSIAGVRSESKGLTSNLFVLPVPKVE